jgi:hypothetical protein
LHAANESWKKAQTLRDIDNHIEASFDNSIGASARANAYRGFNGNKLRSSLKTLSQKYGERQLNRILGTEQYNNLVKIADITRTSADRARFGSSVQAVAKSLLPHLSASSIGGFIGHHLGGPVGGAAGAAAGESMLLASERVMRAVATNPKIGRNLTFAIESGARPEAYAPLIASQISKGNMQK